MNIEIRYSENRDVARHLYLIAGNSYYRKLYYVTFPVKRNFKIILQNPEFLRTCAGKMLCFKCEDASSSAARLICVCECDHLAQPESHRLVAFYWTDILREMFSRQKRQET